MMAAKIRRYDWFTPAAHKVACGAVYRKSCVKDIRFSDDLYIGEDTLFLAECIKKASKIVRSESELYYYYRNDQSVTLCDYFTGKLTEMMAWFSLLSTAALTTGVEARTL